MQTDVAIIGSGFAGSLLAMILRRLGHSVVLLEKGHHPRFAIGESSTPITNLLLEEIAATYDLPQISPLSKWGTWQQHYPEITAGLKRGFTFYHHQFNQPFKMQMQRANHLAVAASPHDHIADTHWYRPDFDCFLVREAQKLGAEYFDGVTLQRVTFDKGACLEGERAGDAFSLQADFVVDASGPRGFLHRTLQLPDISLKHLPPTQALFTHFKDVQRLDEMPCHLVDAVPPYPLDDAALHHVFDGGWIWVLRFNNGITSAGVAATDEVAQELRFNEGAAAWERLMQQLPTVREQFGGAQPLLPWMHSPRVGFRSETVTGDHWALLPSAAGFIDPLLSTGFPLTLLGVARLAEIIQHHWNSPELASHLQTYASKTRDELEAVEQLVSALYARMNDFEVFTRLSLLYFAAASYTETARRLHKPHLAGGFLMHNHPEFGPGMRMCCERARNELNASQRQDLLQDIQQLIEPFDVAGLGDSMRQNWYPVSASDLLRASHKVSATKSEIEQLLARCGF
jgi:FADH2 O2-dependent halogenase